MHTLGFALAGLAAAALAPLANAQTHDPKSEDPPAESTITGEAAMSDLQAPSRDLNQQITADEKKPDSPQTLDAENETPAPEAVKHG